MARWRGGRTPGSGPTEGDEVQRSLELLDRVLSEFDDLENGNVQGGQEAAAAAEARSRPQQHQRPQQQPAIPVAAPEEEQVAGQGHVSSTPEDESPSLGGHQSEDDGYMSMNGRRAKFVLSFRPVPDEGGGVGGGGGQQVLDLPPAPDPPPDPPPTEMADFPPPPEEAERIISTLLPRVSPGNSAKRSSVRRGREFLSAMTLGAEDRQQHSRVTTATQTTLPKTRHQRPYGWETGTNVQQPFHLQEQFRFGSLPYDGGLQYARFPPPWLQRPLPPRTVPGAIERHREVRRRGGTEGSADGEDPCPQPVMRTVDELTDDERNNFSDDSLEEMLPPPSTTLASSKRNSIAWEVPLDDALDDPLYTPGSTKVVGRRRRKSGDHSSSGSIHRLREHDDWPEPPLSTEDEAASPFSDSYYDSSATNEQDDSCNHPLPSKNMTPNGTYVIRKGRKKERKPLPQPPEIIEYNSPRSGDLKRCSSTFDNIKSLLKEGLLEGLDDAPPDFAPPAPPTIVRVVSLPSLAPTTEIDMLYQHHQHHHRPSKTDVHRLSRPHELAVTMEEEEELGPYKDLSESEVNEEERRLIEQLQRQQLSTSSESIDKPLPPSPKQNGSCDDVASSGKEHVATITVEADSCWTTASEMKNENPSVPIVEQKNGEVEHEFPPLPPSPVEEDEDEYSEILHQTPGKSKADTLPEPFYRSLEPPASDPCGSNFLNRPCPPEPPPHNMSSLKTRSMDAGFTRGYRNHGSDRREVPSERRTLPSELPGPLRRRTFQKRSAQSPRDETMQTSCSLPETPIFARGCDIPRTPHRRAPDIPSMARTTPRPGGLASVGYRQQHRTGTGHGAGGLSQALVGAELLRLAGGPGRGWYPRHRQQSTRPASIEHLDRLTPGHSTPSPWEARDSRKPLTLPPNLSPKFFHRSPREALRRVTSLLIRKGNSPKEPKKDALSPTRGIPGEATGEGSRQKRGFFKNFWKRSRHYSLEHQ